MKRFSKIQETENSDFNLKLCFKFAANKDPSGDLRAAGLAINYHRGRWHGGDDWNYAGTAYIFTGSREELEKAQE